MTNNTEAIEHPEFYAFAQREYRSDENFTARDLLIAYRAWRGALLEAQLGGQLVSTEEMLRAARSIEDLKRPYGGRGAMATPEQETDAFWRIIGDGALCFLFGGGIGILFFILLGGIETL